MRTLQSLLSVTLCATVFFACGAPAPRPVSDKKLPTGEETAKTVSDAARKAEAENNTGIRSESSKVQTAKTEPAETQPTKKEPAKKAPVKPTTTHATFKDGVLTVDSKTTTSDALLATLKEGDTVVLTVSSGDPSALEAKLKAKKIKVERAAAPTTQPTK